MSAARQRLVLADGVLGSTRPRRPDMLRKASARPERGRMSAQREFSDGEVIPGTRYRVVGLIGAGGMGSVYEVEHVELGKRFVLKALLRNLTNRDDLVHRLRNEWRALGKLEHPNIVSVTDAGISSTGLPYFVMERLKGETLAACLRRDGRLPVRRALDVAADVLDGLSAAHRIGIVHRDVKPPNVFLGVNRAKLLDFGIAKMLDPKASQITGRGIAIGTPRYMAPEQATGEAVDARTDLYSVGLLLFEMIAGTGPFDSARDSNELFLAHIAKTAPPLSSVAPFAPAALDHWLAKMLAKKAVDRPANAASVSVALRALSAELSPCPGKAPRAPKEDRTLDGGPFDTLEGAQTVLSDGAPVAAFAETRTGIGPPRASDRAPVWNADAVQSGQTLQIDAVTSGDEIPTHTAAPVIHPQTPPPVSETPAPVRRAERRWGKVSAVATAVVALGAGAAFSMRYTRDAASRPNAGSVGRSTAGVAREHVASPNPGASAPRAIPTAEPEANAIPAEVHQSGPGTGAEAPAAVAPRTASSASPPARSVAMRAPQSASSVLAAGPLVPRASSPPAAPVAARPRRSKPKASPGEPLPGSGL